MASDRRPGPARPSGALLRDPARATSRFGARKHLLTYGVGECGRCGAVLRVVTRGGHELYVCDGSKGCVGRRRKWVDDLVQMVIVERLSRPDAWDLLVGDDDAAAESRNRATGIRARLDAAADDYARHAGLRSHRGTVSTQNCDVTAVLVCTDRGTHTERIIELRRAAAAQRRTALP